MASVDEPSGPDPLAEEHEALDANRARVLAVASLIVPAHGAPFAPGAKILPDTSLWVPWACKRTTAAARAS